MMRPVRSKNGRVGAVPCSPTPAEAGYQKSRTRRPGEFYREAPEGRLGSAGGGDPGTRGRSQKIRPARECGARGWLRDIEANLPGVAVGVSLKPPALPQALADREYMSTHSKGCEGSGKLGQAFAARANQGRQRPALGNRFLGPEARPVIAVARSAGRPAAVSAAVHAAPIPAFHRRRPARRSHPGPRSAAGCLVHG
jgi:hypothetical protein